MKLGLHSAILAQSTFEDVIDTASRIGYTAVEIVCWPAGKAERRYAGVTHIDVTALDEQRCREINHYAKDRKVTIAALGYYPNPLDPNTDHSEMAIGHIRKVIEAAALLGVNKVSTFIGKDKTKSIEENLVLFEKVWKPIIEFAEEKKVWVGIENCPMYFTPDEWPGGLNLASSPHIWKKMFETFDSPYFGLTYDPSHLYFQGMDCVRPIYEFKDRIRHIHIKDIRIFRDKLDEHGIFTAPLDYMAPKLPGLGGIDWSAFTSALYDIGYEGAACVEVEDRAFEETEEDRMRAVELSFRYMSQFI
jgi:sugar phosphate isomerase/epimerase